MGCDWHTVMAAVVAVGEPLIEDPARIGPVSALGLDEALFAREGRFAGSGGRLRSSTFMGLLRAGDPRREVWFAWNAKEVVRQLYEHTDVALAAVWIDETIRDFADREMPAEVR